MDLRLNNVGYEVHGRPIIRSVNIHSASNQCIAVIGLNGSGKTSLLKMCQGLLPVTQGELLWDGQDVHTQHAHIVMVFQQPCLLRRTVYAQLNYILSLRKIQRAQRAAAIDEMLDAVDLRHLQHQAAHTLSGGEQQRLAVACAGLFRAKVVLMDEPTGWLDLFSKKIIEQLICRWQAMGTKIIFSSHDLEQVKRLADEIVFLHQGRCIRHCDKQTFFSEFPTEEALCKCIDTLPSAS